MSSENRVIAIDGPASSGKSSTARLLAQRLNYKFLDTGAYYRIATLHCMRNNIELRAPNSVLSAVSCLVKSSEKEVVAENLSVGLHTGFGVSLDPNLQLAKLASQNVTAQIRTEAVTKCVHHISSNAGVRRILIELQQKIVDDYARSGIVLEGRDTTDVVAPNAALKILLTANNEVRALRRAKQSGEDVKITAKSIAVRDSLDLNTTNFLKTSAVNSDIVVIDNSNLTIYETVQKILNLVFDKPLRFVLYCPLSHSIGSK